MVVREAAFGIEAGPHLLEAVPLGVARLQRLRALKVDLPPVGAAVVVVHDPLDLAEVLDVGHAPDHVDRDVCGLPAVGGAQRDVIGRDESDLDELFRDILKFHWIDESQHAKADTILIDEIAGSLTEAEREAAVDELLELGMAIDGLLAQQIEMDIDSLAAAIGRTFTKAELEEIRTHQRRSYRWTFLVSGLEHPNVVRLVNELTSAGGEKVAGAAAALAA